METDNLDKLQPNPNNPRTISKHDFDALKRSIKQFGDLSGIVFNTRTQRLVGGHQRIEAFKRLQGEKRIVITQRLPHPTNLGTVATGHVVLDNEFYGYREVEWDEGIEAAANIAANRIQGEFDKDLLAQMTYELSQLENGQDLVSLTGQTESEVDKLLKAVGAIDDPESQADDEQSDNERFEFAVTREQREVINEALEHIKARRDIASAETASMNGNALYYMSRDYLDRLHGIIPNTPPTQPEALPEQPLDPASQIPTERLDEPPTE